MTHVTVTVTALGRSVAYYGTVPSHASVMQTGVCPKDYGGVGGVGVNKSGDPPFPCDVCHLLLPLPNPSRYHPEGPHEGCIYGYQGSLALHAATAVWTV